jgi:hypothetical protein
MESHSPTDPAEAAVALRDVRSGRLAASRRISTSWWYHPLVGATLAAMVGSGSLRGPAQGALLAGSVAALLGLFWLYRRLTGLWINILNVPGMKRATVLAAVTALTALGVAVLLEDGMGLRGSQIAAGALLGAAYTVYWRWVERELVRLWRAAP